MFDTFIEKLSENISSTQIMVHGFSATFVSIVDATLETFSDNPLVQLFSPLWNFINGISNLLAQTFDGVGHVLTVVVDVPSSINEYITFLPAGLVAPCLALLSLILSLTVVRWIT